MKNFFLFLLSIVVSLIFAYPFGYLTRMYFPSGMSGFIFPIDFLYFSNGLFFAYLFINPIIFIIWGMGRKWLKIFTASVPLVIFLFIIDPPYFTWAFLFFAAGILIAGAIERAMSSRTKVSTT